VAFSLKQTTLINLDNHKRSNIDPISHILTRGDKLIMIIKEQVQKNIFYLVVFLLLLMNQLGVYQIENKIKTLERTIAWQKDLINDNESRIYKASRNKYGRDISNIESRIGDIENRERGSEASLEIINLYSSIESIKSQLSDIEFRALTNQEELRVLKLDYLYVNKI